MRPFKPCGRLKLPVVIKNYCRENLPDYLRLMILEAVLYTLARVKVRESI